MAVGQLLRQRPAPRQSEHVDLVVTEFFGETVDDPGQLTHRRRERGAGLPATPGASNAIVSRSVR